ncbi:ovostatin-like isoform X2 [Eleutherodactylus coqui]|uniref:Alpha-2-macroglobulin n=1 Tax=Eleutherodactylus coqui TaxID=57060 RepID=A0A8J6JY73_ELECQ|nr:hypothetical protein GDO78_021654 [Eleutherodactylus coqui]
MPEHPVDRRSFSTMGRLLLCAALLCLVLGATAEPQYVLNVPASLVSGDPGKVCVNLIDCNERVSVSVSLEHNGRNVSIIAEDTDSPKYFQCGVFQVPIVTKAVPVAMIFTVTGAKTDLRERKTVVINTASISCMYQMDKPTYKPGQKVNWRLLCLDAQLKPVNQKYTVMYLQDPSRAKITQWLQPESKNGVLSGQFELVHDGALGSYVITAERESGYPLRQYFTVEEYRLPRVSLTLDSPQTISVTDESMKFKLTVMYSYGEPMPGSVTVRYCMQQQYYGRRQNCFKDKGDSCGNMVGELSADGTYEGTIDMHSTSVGSGGRSMNLDVTVTEAGTEIQTTESRYIWVTSQPASLSMDYDSMNQYYKRGINYPLVATLKNERGEPMPNQEIDIQIDNGETAKATTDPDGKIEYAIDTSSMVNPNFTITVSYTNPDQCYYSEWSNKDYPSSEYTVYRFYSFSGSFIQMRRPKGELICGQDYSIDIDYIINSEVKAITFYALMISNSAIVWSGQKDIELGGTKNGTFSMVIPVSYSMAPSSNMVIYSILPNEMIADTTSLNIEKCFKNQVSMTFSEEKVAPGSVIDAQLSAAPNSYCALRVIDSNLLLLNPYEQFSADRVYNSRRTYYFGYNVAGFDVEEPAPPCEDPDKLVFYNGRYYVPRSSSSEGDSYGIVKSVGLVVGTGLRIRKPEVCDNNPPPQNIIPLGGKNPGIGGGGFSSAPMAKLASLEMDSASGGGQIETVRTNFAETFMWVMVPLDNEGHATASDTLPDSITSWQGTAFCTSEESGFGMTRTPANVTTILPFFMDMPVQYSAVRGEVVVLKGVVRNNLEHHVKANAYLQDSPQYDATLTDGPQDACIPPGGHATYTWETSPKVIGEISFTATAEMTFIGKSCDGPSDSSQPLPKDTVVPTMVVEAEGIPQARTISNLVLVQEGKNVQLPISITLPDNVVQDSVKAFVTVVADIIGLSLENLNNLVQKPYGCGDQNLGRLWVIPHILNYLKKTEQLTEETLQKAKGYMSEGYQRQLSFISGGAYRLFSTSSEVNSVLTAETFACFEAISEYVYVDKDRQQQTLIWLENSQKLENGCFRAEGKPVTNQEGDNDVQYTATVAHALLESNYSLGHTLLNGAMECLRTASKSEQNMYNDVLMLYAFTMANDEEYRKPLFDKLMKKAINQDGTIHWEREDMPVMPKVPYFLPPFTSTEMLMTSYMLLSMARNPKRTREDLSAIAQASVWLVRQQNSNGGFSSTRDTRVAIQALAAVAEHFYVPNAQRTVTIRRNDGEVGTFNLNKDNSLVVHKQALPEANGDYLIEAIGSGWTMIQSTTQYNIPVPKENSAYSLSVSSSGSCLNGVARKITLNCTLSYQGSRNESGMAIVKTKMLSGYNPDYSSMSKLRDDNIISKYEITPKGEVVFYLDKVPHEPQLFSFDAMMDRTVYNLQTASATVFSYYEDTENGYAAYSHPCVPVKGASS